MKKDEDLFFGTSLSRGLLCLNAVAFGKVIIDLDSPNPCLKKDYRPPFLAPSLHILRRSLNSIIPYYSLTLTITRFAI